jgi:hypothetical protein
MKGGSVAWGTVQQDVATMTYYYAMNDRESESGAYTNFPCCKKWLEYSLPDDGIDPFSAIADADPCIVAGFESEGAVVGIFIDRHVTHVYCQPPAFFRHGLESIAA